MKAESVELMALLSEAMPTPGGRGGARISIDANWIGIETALPRKWESDAARDLLVDKPSRLRALKIASE